MLFAHQPVKFRMSVANSPHFWHPTTKHMLFTRISFANPPHKFRMCVLRSLEGKPDKSDWRVRKTAV